MEVGRFHVPTLEIMDAPAHSTLLTDGVLRPHPLEATPLEPTPPTYTVPHPSHAQGISRTLRY